MPTFSDSDKAKWPPIRGREDQEVDLEFYTSDPPDTVGGTNALDLSGWNASEFMWSAHTDDNTGTGASQSGLPLASGQVSYIPTGFNNKLRAILPTSATAALQDSGYVRGKIDVWGRDPAGQAKRLMEAVWVLDRSVSTSPP